MFNCARGFFREERYCRYCLERKLIVRWPPTISNLAWLSRNDYFGGIDRILSAVNELEHPTYEILEAGDLSVLDPGTMHAVLSPVNSAVGGWEWVKVGGDWKEVGLAEPFRCDQDGERTQKSTEWATDSNKRDEWNDKALRTISFPVSDPPRAPFVMLIEMLELAHGRNWKRPMRPRISSRNIPLLKCRYVHIDWT